MQPQWIGHVGVILFDSVSANRHLTRNSLFSIGFREVAIPANLNDLRRSIEEANFDLCFVDVTERPEQTCRVIESIRTGLIGRNPFMVIIATSWDQNGELVRRVIDSGADDLILRPVSTGALRTRIGLQIEARKGFVVTSTYIGPDRRRDPSRQGDASLLMVPNTLRFVAAMGLLGSSAMAEVDAARVELDRRRLLQCALGAAIGARLIEAQIAAAVPRRVVAEELVHLAAIGQEVQRRTAQPRFESLAAPSRRAAQAIAEARAAFEAGVGEVAPLLAPLDALCMSAHKELAPDTGQAEIKANIARTLEQIRARSAASARAGGSKAASG